ncbi:hypothetical protein [Nocardioides sp.]|uniref:hypothetical protein n=1 Tax=Nocardioides sp. TaxID=35761 RepID=UPI002ED3BD3F
MTDPHQPDPTRDLTPDEESRVRQLLADARHTEPMPDDVVARLDRVLAGLADEPAREAAVVSLAARRRRVTRLLVAAAAVVVVGVAGSQVLGGPGGTTASEDSQGAAEAPDAESAEEPPAAGADSGADREPTGEGEVTVSKNRVAKVRPQSFAADAEAIRDGSVAFLNDSDTRQSDGAAAVCTAGDWGVGRYVAVRYAGDPGWIVYRRPQGDTQVADLFLCGSEVAGRSLTLPYP